MACPAAVCLSAGVEDELVPAIDRPQVALIDTIPDQADDDRHAAGRQGTGAAFLEASPQIADARRAQCLADRVSFTFETVMSHPSKPQVLARARALGFATLLYFVATDGTIYVSDYGNSVIRRLRPSVSGLAAAVGPCSRQRLVGARGPRADCGPRRSS